MYEDKNGDYILPPIMCGECFCSCNRNENNDKCKLETNPVEKAFEFINKTLERELKPLLTWKDFIDYGKKMNRKTKSRNSNK